ncbi:ABC transporter transmembrane domain-containing protein [Areca yellow leaf disease phytoplasma]|uniref:ABC transporter transmembrane domain-containing protein n=1 Tax=Areca yellow leaf disease phytoplasma TaxID=927614 RepID=UPI0035B536B3
MKATTKKLDELNVITRENLIGIKSIRAFRQSQYETSRFSKVNHKYSFFSIKLFNFMVSIDPIFYLFLNCSILINVGVGVYYLTQSHPDFTTGNFFHVLIINFMFYLLF